MHGRKGINVLVYEKDPEGLRFLRGFFRSRKTMRPHFIGSADELTDKIETAGADALIVGIPNGNDGLHAGAVRVPTVALITGNIPCCLKEVIRHDIEYYLLRPFHEDDLELKLKTAINRKSWFERLYAEKRDLEAIVELTYLISSTLDPREVLYFVVKKLSEMIEVSRCSVISIGFGEKRYAHVVSSFEDPGVSDIRLDLRKYPEIKKALTSKRPIVIQDAMEDPVMKSVRAAIEPLGIRSIVVIPIIYRDEIIGTLFLRTSRARSAFSKREINLCNAIANVSANVLYNAFLFEKLENEKERLERLAITDYLTGVYNIRYFYHRLEEEFSRAERYGHPISCIMMDIDHFKNVNDIYGHRMGDMVLREFAQLVRRHVRRSDVFARYGGEEFIILLPQTPLDGAEKEAGRLRVFIREHRFKGIEERITSSMGISCWPAHDINTHDDLITLADNALFEAKSSGRDRVRTSAEHRKKLGV
ncbi:MAG: sensor domain-containing diguanylate cyclase [Nitrospirae bacterium]|nr:sensor domain-containing diguanylate cyclase [Nitrospirota bacterium]